MRKINAAGLDLIKKFEGCRLKAYLDAVSVPTIGYGHIQDVKMGQVITQHQADIILASDIEIYEERVDNLLGRLAVTSNQFSALVAFAFNLGITALANSTLMKRLKGDDATAAQAEFGKWVKAGGKVLPGLVKRRAAEAALFAS